MSERIEEQFMGRWQPATPEPYWFRHWFRWKPGCYWCQIVMKDREEWVRHYWQEHA